MENNTNVQEEKILLTGTELYAQERERQKQERSHQRGVKRKIKEIEVVLKNSHSCRYHLAYIMLALDTIVAELALNHGLGKVDVKLDNEEITVIVENQSLTSTMLRDMVERALKDEGRYNLGKALMEVDDLKIEIGDEGGLKITVKKDLST